MKKLIIAAIITASFSAQAGTAFKTGERTTGMTKQCYYSYIGSQYTITIQSFKLCPLSIQV